MSFVEKYKADADKYVVLTFHGSGAEDYSDIQEKVQGFSQSLWKGRTLNLPILFDATGKTFRDYNIRFLPNAVLIDPAGRIAIMDSRAAEQMLEVELDKLRASK